MGSVRSRLKRGAVFLSLALAGAPAIVQGQLPTGEIRLAVKDPSGAAMKAAGRLQGLAARIDRSFETDAQGAFTFQNLPYGPYRLEVSKRGFATKSLLIDVQSAKPEARMVTMALATQASKIDVIKAARSIWPIF
jgi:hypothetical protein